MFTVHTGTNLYHGAPEPMASQITSAGQLIGRSPFKAGGGTMDEGGMIWFTFDLKDARGWARGPEAFPGRMTGPGRVFCYTTEWPLIFVDRYEKMDAEMARIANDVLQVPHYKQVHPGDPLNYAVGRAFDSSPLPFEQYRTPGGNMRVIWPLLLAALGAHGFSYHEGKHVAVAADAIQVSPSDLAGLLEV